MKVKVRIDRGNGHISEVWAGVDDAVCFSHQANIQLADGKEVPAGPIRKFKVTILQFQKDDILDSEYIDPSEPSLAEELIGSIYTELAKTAKVRA